MWENMRFRHGELPLSTYSSLSLAVVGYLVGIKMLHEYMKSRKKFDLKNVVITHNAFLCLLSLIMLVGVLYEMTWKILDTPASELVETLFCDPKKKLATGPQIVWFYIFYLSKFYEFFDTVIIVLKQKPLIFLHVYHHFITAVLIFVMMDNEVVVAWIAIAANALVHVPMYYYYAVSAMGINVWWKKYITKLQIFQFVADILGNCIGFYYHLTTNFSCSGVIGSWLFGQAILLSFLVLFINFYSKTYKNRKTEKDE